MANVPNGPITDFYNNTTEGTPANPAIIDAAVQAMVDTINANWQAFISSASGSAGSQNLGAAAISGVSGTTVYAQLVALKAMIDAIIGASIPPQSVTTAMLLNESVTEDKLSSTALLYKLRW